MKQNRWKDPHRNPLSGPPRKESGHPPPSMRPSGRSTDPPLMGQIAPGIPHRWKDPHQAMDKVSLRSPKTIFTLENERESGHNTHREY